MGRVVLRCKVMAKGLEVGIGYVSHVLDVRLIVVVEKLVAKRVDLPGGLHGVGAEVLQYQLGNSDTCEKCKMDDGSVGNKALQLDWTLGRSAGWYAASQSLCCPYFWCCLPPPLVLGGCLLFLPLCCPLGGAGGYVVGCGGGPYWYGGCGTGGAGGNVYWALTGLGYGWYR